MCVCVRARVPLRLWVRVGRQVLNSVRHNIPVIVIEGSGRLADQVRGWRTPAHTYTHAPAPTHTHSRTHAHTLTRTHTRVVLTSAVAPARPVLLSVVPPPFRILRAAHTTPRQIVRAFRVLKEGHSAAGITDDDIREILTTGDLYMFSVAESGEARLPPTTTTTTTSAWRLRVWGWFVRDVVVCASTGGAVTSADIAASTPPKYPPPHATLAPTHPLM
jgi:hypothetical protein